MKKFIFDHFSASVVQTYVHINMYIQMLPPNEKIPPIKMAAHSGRHLKLELLQP